MPASPFPITATETNEMITQMQSLMDDLYQNRLGGACVGDVFMVDDDDIFKLKYLAIGGLQKIAGSLAILPNTSKGIDCDRNGIFVVLEADKGLAFNGTSGIYVKLKAGGGLAVDTNGLYATNSFPITAAGGTVDAITADYSTNLTLTDKVICAVVAAGANTSATPSFAPDGLTAHTIVKFGGQALIAGDISGAGHVCLLEYNLANTRWELLNPQYGAAASGTWNPVYGCQTGTFATMTMDATGSYYKIGKLVYFTCDVKTDNVDATGASGNLYITGLPFVPSVKSSLAITFVSGWAGEYPIEATLTSFANSNIALKYRTAVDGAASYTQVSDMTTGAVANQNRVIISGCYLS
jgi:hypothetical protein